MDYEYILISALYYGSYKMKISCFLISTWNCVERNFYEKKFINSVFFRQVHTNLFSPRGRAYYVDIKDRVVREESVFGCCIWAGTKNTWDWNFFARISFVSWQLHDNHYHSIVCDCCKSMNPQYRWTSAGKWSDLVQHKPQNVIIFLLTKC